MDFDAFEERAAIAEYDGGLTRFAAETLAAREQGYERWEVINAKRERDTSPARDQRAATVGQSTDDLPGVFPRQAEEAGPLPERDLQAGRRGVVLSPLRAERRVQL